MDTLLLDHKLDTFTNSMKSFYTLDFIPDFISIFYTSWVLATIWVIVIVILLFEKKVLSFISVTWLISFWRSKSKHKVTIDQVLKSNKF